MPRYVSFLALFILGGCSFEDHQKVTETHPDSANIVFERNGVLNIDFYDAEPRLHIASMLVHCGRSLPCDMQTLVLDQADTGLLKLLENPTISYEEKLRNFGAELNRRVPEKKRLHVHIGIVVGGDNKDVVGLVIPFFEKYAFLKPDTVEVSSLPQDSISAATNKEWRLLSDSIEFRHIVDLGVQRFVRK